MLLSLLISLCCKYHFYFLDEIIDYVVMVDFSLRCLLLVDIFTNVVIITLFQLLADAHN